MRGRQLLPIGLIALASACSTDADESLPATSDDATPALSTAASPTTFPIDETVVSEPGSLADGALTVDGLEVEYVTITPDGFRSGDTAPVLLAFPPGGQSIVTTRSVAQSTYFREATERGWVVFSPAAPVDGDRWDQESSALIPSLLDWIETWVTPEGGAVHVAGVSNGGLSTFAAAALVPDRVQSLLTFPGFPRGDEARRALPGLTGVPVRMFVGETDSGWVESMQAAADTLDDLGGDITLEILAGEGHVIASLRDGQRIFDELDAVRTR